MRDFALIGAAGFVAVRHMRAIAETGNRLVAALDPNDSVGVLDAHFPDAHFFVEFERFDRHIDKLRRRGAPVSFVSSMSREMTRLATSSSDKPCLESSAA